MPSQYLAPALGACLVLVVQALPQVSFPIDAQVPPAAVAGEIYTFTFSSQTFTSAEALKYSLLGSPSWLQFTSSTRTLGGTPSALDIGTTTLQIQASDAEGSATTELSLLVLAKSSLKVKQDVVDGSLRRAGSTSTSSTLSLHPQAEFDLTFGPLAFESDAKTLHFYATSEGHTPLPAWISFDAAAVSFRGRTPDLLTPQSSPQTFAFSLAAGQTSGVSEANFNFEISVTNHILMFLDPVRSYNITSGQHFEIQSLLGALNRDGIAIEPGAIRARSSNHPAWLVMKADDLSYSGIVPVSPETLQFQLSVTDDQNNVAAIQFSLVSTERASELYKRTYLQPVDAIRKQVFTYTFNISDQLLSSSTLDIDVSPVGHWLTWNPRNATINGRVPENQQLGSFNVSVTISKDAQVEGQLQLPVNVIQSTVTSNGGNASSTQNSSQTSVSSTDNEDSSGEDESDLDHKELALKVALPLLAAAALLCVILIVLRLVRNRRPRTATVVETDLPSDSVRTQSSMRQSSSGNIVIVGQSSTTESLRSFLASSPPPRIDMTWSTYQRPLSRLFSNSSRDGKHTPTTRSSWSDMLNEVDSPIYHGHYNKIDDHGLGVAEDDLPPAPTKVNYLTRQSTVTPVIRGLDKQKKSALASSSRFSGRRKSGLGHGVSYAESASAANDNTLRQVPLSPLREGSLVEQSSKPITTRYRIARNPSSSKTLTKVYSDLEQIRSTTSSSSRYDDPDMESSEGSFYHNKDQNAGWNDQDWQTMSNESETSSKFQQSNSRQDRQECQQVLPSLCSDGTPARNQQSRTNSLRFI